MADNMEILRFKKANCKNCFKCLRECPVKAIGFQNDQAEILRDECLICGHCLTVCPQNAKEVRNDVNKVKALFEGDKPVYASLAPSFVGAFGNPQMFQDALISLGFAGAYETAVGAKAVAMEYQRLLRSGKYKSLISTCCPTIIKLVEKYHPDAVGFLAPVVSPMVAHARMLRKKYGDIRVVFIGPCISKKDEAGWSTDVDCVLTFEEVRNWMETEKMPVFVSDAAFSLPKKSSETMAARLFPESGGILKTMPERLDGVGYESISGVTKCRQVIEELIKGNLDGYFLEMSACEGSCLNGPCMIFPEGGYLKAQKAVQEFFKESNSFEEPLDVALEKTFTPRPILRDMPGESTIREILAKTGKYKPEQELNCGACGYPTCREKAIAVYQGKAEITMCMPYMRERAEYISDNVIAFTPNAVIVLDGHLNIQAINQAACTLFGFSDSKQCAGKYIGELFEASLFEEAMMKKENRFAKGVYLYRYKKYVDETVVYVKDHDFIFGILHDVTQVESQNEELKKVRLDTVETANSVIEKQMRVVQEIAMLLGETAAETKVALTKLKDTMMSGEE